MYLNSVLFCAALTCFGCSEPSVPVCVVVRDGFRGGILIYPECEDGVFLERINGVWQFATPPNGILRIRSGHPVLGTATHVAARFESGKPIPLPIHISEPLDTDGLSIADSQIIMDDVGVVSVNSGPPFWYCFVGTLDEARAARGKSGLSSWDNGRIHPEYIPFDRGATSGNSVKETEIGKLR
jgi:hypothetical protein